MPSVYVSPSSQEHNIYATGGTEEQIMNQVADKVVPLLNHNNITTKRNSTAMDLSAIIRDSNKSGCDVHLAIHSNAGRASGCEVFVYHNLNKISNSEKLGQLVYNELSIITPVGDRGIKDGKAAKLGEIVNTRAVAILIEVDFHDTKEGSTWIKSNVDAIAEAIVKGVCKYFGIVYKPLIQEQYLVYGIKLLGNGVGEEYAIAKAKQLKEQGYEVYYLRPNGTRVNYKE